jgi:hypothetical protein
MDAEDRVALDGVEEDELATLKEFFSPSVNGTGSGAANVLDVAKEEEYEFILVLESIAEVAFELAIKEVGAEKDSEAECCGSLTTDEED